MGSRGENRSWEEGESVEKESRGEKIKNRKRRREGREWEDGRMGKMED
jgi:hypothetical protein